MPKPEKGLVQVDKFDKGYFKVGAYVSFIERQYPTMDEYPRAGGEGIIEEVSENEIIIRYLNSCGQFINYKGRLELFVDKTLTINIIRDIK